MIIDVGSLLLLLLPIVAAVAWYVGQRQHTSRSFDTKFTRLSREYFIGLNYLLDEQHDKAVDIFINVLKVDQDTIETYLALGSLYRRRGEVDRAIKIHLNLIHRENLSQEQRTNALIELAQDYLKAGVLDRAEKIFLEVLELGEQTVVALNKLLAIYEQEQDWQAAIKIASRLQLATSQKLNQNIAQYYCELASKHSHSDEATQYLQRALSIDRNCVRASLLEGKIAFDKGNYKAAINAYKRIKSQDAEYLPEVINPLARCYQALDSEDAFIDYLWQLLQNYPSVPVVLRLATHIRKEKGKQAASEFVYQHLQKNPSLAAVEQWLELQSSQSAVETREDFKKLHKLIHQLISSKHKYVCKHCGFQARELYWQCMGCRYWSKMKPLASLGNSQL